MGKIQVSILDLLTTRLDELTMEIGMRRGGDASENILMRSSIKMNRASTVAHYMFLFTTRN